MILTLPYYDPTGKFNQAFQKQSPTLRASFESVCLSIVPPTLQANGDIAKLLKEEGFFIGENAEGTLHGAHSREALRLALQHAAPGQSIFFGFEQRILYALETKWRASFLQDATTLELPFVVFERSPKAWDTHPANFREIEQMVSRMCQFMHGQTLDLMPCAFVFSYSSAKTILEQSTSATTEVWGEWLLLALKNNIPVKRREVDWLAWKDSHWEGYDSEKLKRIRETSQDETIKRIKMNVPTMLMLTEERFRTLTIPPMT